MWGNREGWIKYIAVLLEGLKADTQSVKLSLLERKQGENQYLGKELFHLSFKFAFYSPQHIGNKLRFFEEKKQRDSV